MLVWVFVTGGGQLQSPVRCHEQIPATGSAVVSHLMLAKSLPSPCCARS